MSAIILSSGDYLVGCLESGIVSNQPSFVACYIDNFTDIAGNSKGFFNGTGEKILVSYPESGQRIISRIDIFNKDSLAIIPHLKIKNELNEYDIINKYIDANSNLEILSIVESTNSLLLPSVNQKAALLGTSGELPSISNPYATKATTDTEASARSSGDALALKIASNLSDLNNAATARSNLGLGTAAVTASTAYATAAQGATADSTASALTSHTGNTSNPHAVTKAQVGLPNCDNTSDANKPLSNAAQTAFSLKAPLASPALTGTPTAPTAAAGTNTTQIATCAFLQSELDDLIPFSPILSKTGDGTGVATLTFTLSAPTTVRLDGYGYFYTDSGGTTGETQKKRLAAGANTLYIKVKKSSSVLTFLQGPRMTRFDSWSAGTNAPSISFSLADLPSGVTYVGLYGNNTVSGSLADLPAGVTYVAISGYNTVSGSLADLPSGVPYVAISGYNTVSGSLADLPSGVTYVSLYGYNTISGSLADSPAGLTLLSVGGYNTISGSLADSPAGLTLLAISGNNTVSGSLADLPSGVTYVSLSGNNTVSGSLADLPSGVTYVAISGYNTCTYNTASGSRTWASGMRYVYCRSVGATSMTSAMIDAILIDLSAQATWSNDRSVSLKGTRTSASDAAVSTLTGYGVVVTVTA